MKSSVAIKLLLSYLFVALSVFIILNTYGAKTLEINQLNERKNILYNEADLISTEYMSAYYRGEMESGYLSTQLKTIDNFLDIRIWIVNINGEIISDSRKDIRMSTIINVNDFDETFLNKTFSDYTYFKDYMNEPMLSVVLPVYSEFKLRGYIVILSALSNLENEKNGFLDILNLSCLILLIVIAITFGIIAYIILNPLNKLIKAASEYTLNHYDYRITLKGDDEFNKLSKAMNFMASELSLLDDYQKKFIANISHDFRSPLTSIKGYAEAILDGTIPKEMQDKYLNIILFETERLNKLTNNLLVLNTFDNKGTILDIVNFDINHMIKQTAESFEGICNEKKITLHLIFVSKSLSVSADMGKIQQVLYNLIDNAVKFSSINSSIKVSTSEKNDKIFISIKDNGIGIPKDSIKKIWDRFYKTDISRGKDKKGTGLGLSITKEIIQAHGENINVISTEDVGTEFTFTLPKGGS